MCSKTCWAFRSCDALSCTGCSQHAPNEHILWSLTREGMGLVTGVYWDLGDPETAYRP